MKATYLLIAILLGNITLLTAQPQYFSNYSFEGLRQINIAPPGWDTTCNPYSTPDTQPGCWGDTLSPFIGSSYLGLCMRGVPFLTAPLKNEDAETKLLIPLYPNTPYQLTIYLAHFDVTDSGNYEFGSDSIVYEHDNQLPRLRVSGGKSSCVFDQVFAISEPVANTTWEKYTFYFVPSDTCYYLHLEDWSDTLKDAYLLLDDINICTPSSIGGNLNVCRGQQNVSYYLISCFSIPSLQWHYSGLGSIINGNSDTVTLDFDNNATSGNLMVYFNFNGVNGTDSLTLPINVIPLPSVADSITGENWVCFAQNGIDYYVNPVNNSLSYIWDYTGRGASISGTSDSIEMSFTGHATDGYLTVMGVNSCGTGNPSPPFSIALKCCVPSFSIAGNNAACQGQKNVQFSLQPAYCTSGYLWGYSGSGATITGSSDTITVDFMNNATNGILSVYFYNNRISGNDTASVAMSLSPLPSDADTISGNNIVCYDQKELKYHTNPVVNATSYLWNYNGNGAIISGTSDSIEINFARNSTNGELTVRGTNLCGTGNTSPPFSISMKACNPDLPENFYIPNAFTPNGDGVNDLFVIIGLPSNSKLLIFDRLGVKVFESDNYQNDWNGIDSKGNVLGNDTYWYVLSIPGISSDFKGYVYMKR